MDPSDVVDADDVPHRRAEVAGKLRLVRAMAHAHGLDAIHLTGVATTAWLTSGATTYIDESCADAAFTVLVTPDEALALSDPIEAPRLRDEEHLDTLGFRIVEEPWHRRGAELARLSATLRIGEDRPSTRADLSGALHAARDSLTPGEVKRMREGGRQAAEAMLSALAAIEPGMTEHQAAGALARAARERGGSPVVVLAGSDERIARYRHPLPTEKPIERSLMLVLCFRSRGLVTALTRSVHWGRLPAELREKSLAVAHVQARMIAATEPGRTLGEMYETARRAYAAEGYLQAIEEHHQGGRIGYLSREQLARPGDPTPISARQAFAWNPSVTGAKAEDTQWGQELITANAPEDWPCWEFILDGHPWSLPAILER